MKLVTLVGKVVMGAMMLCFATGARADGLEYRYEIGAMVGGLLNIIATLRAVVFLFKDKLKADSIPWFIFFVSTYITVYILNFTLFVLTISLSILLTITTIFPSDSDTFLLFKLINVKIKIVSKTNDITILIIFLCKDVSCNS